MPEKIKVVIIGGGLSGLTAAQDLLNSGLPIELKVLEARGRLGGRIETTVMNNGDIVELGANWLHGDLDRHSLSEFALSPTSAGSLLNAVSYPKEMTKVFYDSAEYEIDKCNLIWKEIETMRIELRNTAELMAQVNCFQDEVAVLRELLLKKFPAKDILPVLDMWSVRIAEGANPLNECVSEVFHNTTQLKQNITAIKKSYKFLEPEGDEFFVVNGLTKVIEQLTKNIPVILEARVTEVEQLGHGIVTHYENRGKLEVIKSDYVINTLPIGVLRSNSVKFTPLLSEAKQRAIRQFAMTEVIKIALTFKSDAYLDAIIQPHHPLIQTSVVIDSIDPRLARFFVLNLHALTALSQSARPAGMLSSSTLLLYISDARFVPTLNDMKEAELIDLCLRSIVRYYPSLSKSSLIDSKARVWSREPYSCGAYPYILQGISFEDIEALAMPEGRMLMAGDALGIELAIDTASEQRFNIHHSGMHSAVISGHNAAQAIIKELRI